MRSDRLVDVLAGLLAALGLALVLVPVSSTYDLVVGGTPYGTDLPASCGSPLGAVAGRGEPASPVAVAPVEGRPDLQADVDAAALAEAQDVCRGTGAVYLLLGVTCLGGAAVWFAVRRFRANAPRRAARQAAWRAAHPVAEGGAGPVLVRPAAGDDLDWDDHDESFGAERDTDFDGRLLGEAPAAAAPGHGPEPDAPAAGDLDADTDALPGSTADDPDPAGDGRGATGST